MWYLGAMNDGLFIINKPPRSAEGELWQDQPDGPSVVLGPFTTEALAQAVVDAHNATIVTGVGAVILTLNGKPLQNVPDNARIIFNLSTGEVIGYDN